jgi:hypothetical protein
MFEIHFIGFLISKRKSFVPNSEPSKPILLVLLVNILAMVLFPLTLAIAIYATYDAIQDQRKIKQALLEFSKRLKSREEEEV